LASGEFANGRRLAKWSAENRSDGTLRVFQPSQSTDTGYVRANRYMIENSSIRRSFTTD
jgi:hypothetical protein